MTLANISECGNWFRQEFQKVTCLSIRNVGFDRLLYLWQNDFCLEMPPQQLQSFTFLRQLRTENCSNLVSFHKNCPAIASFPAGGLPNTNSRVSIQDCEKLEALPDHFNSLDSLTGLDIVQFSSLKSFTEKGFPTNLSSLSVQDPNIYKALVEWGFHKLTSLTFFWVGGCLDVESFPQGRNGNAVALPASLIYLIIRRFPKLKYLSDDGFRNLTYLEGLRIQDCPNLKSFPKRSLPSSLLKLDIKRCPLPKEECKRDKGKGWLKISHIPCVKIDKKIIYDLQEED